MVQFSTMCVGMCIEGVFYFLLLCMYLCTQPLTLLNLFLVTCVPTRSINFEMLHRAPMFNLSPVASILLQPSLS